MLTGNIACSSKVMGMQDHENEREQNPASRDGEETLAYGTSGQQTPADWRRRPRATRLRDAAARRRRPTGPAARSRRPTGPATARYSAAAASLSQSQDQSAGSSPAGRPEQPADGRFLGQSEPEASRYGRERKQPSYGRQAARQKPAAPPYPGSWQPPGAGNWPPPPGASFGQWGTPPRRHTAAAVAPLPSPWSRSWASASGPALRTGSPSTTTHRRQSSSPGAQAVPTSRLTAGATAEHGTSKLNVQRDRQRGVAIGGRRHVEAQLLQRDGRGHRDRAQLVRPGADEQPRRQRRHPGDRADRRHRPRPTRPRVLGTDKTDDVALLQLQGASGLKAASIGDSSKVAVGDAGRRPGQPRRPGRLADRHLRRDHRREPVYHRR